MVANTRRNSTNINIPTITVVDSQNERKVARSCCGCIPERVGVFAILSVYFFLGTFYSLTSFVGLVFTRDTGTIVFTSISGILYAFIAIVSALSANAIRKENDVMMRRLAIAFWIITALMLIYNIVSYTLLVVFRSSTIQACNNAVSNGANEDGSSVDCSRVVDDSLISEAIRTFVTGTISIYFAYVIFKYAKMMKETQNLGELPLTAPVNRPPVYFVYSTQPPTSKDWVPPTYTVKPTNPLPDDFKPDSKQTAN